MANSICIGSTNLRGVLRIKLRLWGWHRTLLSLASISLRNTLVFSCLLFLRIPLSFLFLTRRISVTFPTATTLRCTSFISRYLRLKLSWITWGYFWSSSNNFTSCSRVSFPFLLSSSINTSFLLWLNTTGSWYLLLSAFLLSIIWLRESTYGWSPMRRLILQVIARSCNSRLKRCHSLWM